MSRKGHKHKAGFEGGQMRLIRRIPKRGFNAPAGRHVVLVNVRDLSRFDAGSEITSSTLRSSGLAKGTDCMVKILGGGTLDKKLIVKASAFSATARAKIEAAGGVCEVVTN
jgi:large subunit ribosomal protein L15